eukprot:snap_masked-scaffold20_size707684-processed-gene-3.2 protein:Tk03848 transcript:snap_masked-scaffold20_size707684-processed-gene-3.2-mRNA-1 annotation:"alpha- -mannosyl-glycoprotein 4-beta-n-acetylglucosaminyltransferase b"
MLLPPRFRRPLLVGLASLCTLLGLGLWAWPAPDLSQELILARRMTELALRVRAADRLNAHRQWEVQHLFQQFARLATQPVGDGSLGASPVGAALWAGANWTYDLSLPSIHHFLPHLLHAPHALQPAFKAAPHPPRSSVSMVLGIPTVRRAHQSYLGVTLTSVIDNLAPEELNDCLIIVFVAETDLEFVGKVVQELRSDFAEHMASGLIEVISPPADFYPDLSGLQPTLGDNLERVMWRSKQNLDYAFLMMYAQWRGQFYVQLEDDILTKPGFLSIMKNFALDRTARDEPWFVIDYCQLGFIGKLFQTSDLPTLVQFFLMFFKDKPGDWLLENVIQTRVCKLDQDFKKCKKERDKLWVHYKPSLFQHIGTHSSLKGKVQKLKDKQFGKISMFVPHFNPPARIETVIKHYKSYSITRAYHGETFYWGLVPQAGDTITFYLMPPTPLAGYKFVSGNAEHPSDRFLDTQIEVKISEDANARVPQKWPRTSDGFVQVGAFESSGVATADMGVEWGSVSHLRLSIHASSDNWSPFSGYVYEDKRVAMFGGTFLITTDSDYSR